jgi:heme-degrading monooxygenase HmoA
VYAVIWQYQVRPDQAARFEALYGPQGDWVALFRAWPGYQSTELLRGDDGHYLTIDRWDSREAYATFQRQAADDYARIDALGDALALDERRIGAFTLASP